MRAEGSEEEGLVGVAAEGVACTSEDGYVDTGPSGGIRPCMRRRVVRVLRGADHDSILNGASERSVFEFIDNRACAIAVVSPRSRS